MCWKLGRAGGSFREQVIDCIRETGIGFLYAPLLHPAVKHAQEARLLLKGRTVFNLLGPLTNPVRARMQLIGAFSVRAAEMLAQASARLGIERAFVVHGADGLDEITTTATHHCLSSGGRPRAKGPLDARAISGCPQASLEDLKGGDPETNAHIVRSVLNGEPGPRRDIVVVNAAAALLLAQRAIRSENRRCAWRPNRLIPAQRAGNWRLVEFAASSV